MVSGCRLCFGRSSCSPNWSLAKRAQHVGIRCPISSQGLRAPGILTLSTRLSAPAGGRPFGRAVAATRQRDERGSRHATTQPTAAASKCGVGGRLGRFSGQ